MYSRFAVLSLLGVGGPGSDDYESVFGLQNILLYVPLIMSSDLDDISSADDLDLGI